MNLVKLTTEMRNKATTNIDQMSTKEMLRTINQEDKTVAYSVEKVLAEVAIAVDRIFDSLADGGRLFYVGAGTSGRLGVLDASECVPTFMVPEDMVQTIMAGGERAIVDAVEGAEDDEDQGAIDIQKCDLTEHDVVMGITASGRTPYPIGAVKAAKQAGAYTIALSSNQESEIGQYVDCNIEVIVGPEVLTGSTRMKAATSHKMILNMISTSVMIKLGKVYENLMVDVHASNVKLKERAKSIITEITNVPYHQAEEALEKTGYKVKIAIVMIVGEVTYEQAQDALKDKNGYVREAIHSLS